MNETRILASELLVGDFLVLGTRTTQVTYIATDDSDVIYCETKEGPGPLTFQPGDTVSIVDNLEEPFELYSSHNSREENLS